MVTWIAVDFFADALLSCVWPVQDIQQVVVCVFTGRYGQNQPTVAVFNFFHNEDVSHICRSLFLSTLLLSGCTEHTRCFCSFSITRKVRSAHYLSNLVFPGRQLPSGGQQASTEKAGHAPFPAQQVPATAGSAEPAGRHAGAPGPPAQEAAEQAATVLPQERAAGASSQPASYTHCKDWRQWPGMLLL